MHPEEDAVRAVLQLFHEAQAASQEFKAAWAQGRLCSSADGCAPSAAAADVCLEWSAATDRLHACVRRMAALQLQAGDQHIPSLRVTYHEVFACYLLRATAQAGLAQAPQASATLRGVVAFAPPRCVEGHVLLAAQLLTAALRDGASAAALAECRRALVRGTAAAAPLAGGRRGSGRDSGGGEDTAGSLHLNLLHAVCWLVAGCAGGCRVEQDGAAGEGEGEGDEESGADEDAWARCKLHASRALRDGQELRGDPVGFRATMGIRGVVAASVVHAVAADAAALRRRSAAVAAAPEDGASDDDDDDDDDDEGEAACQSRMMLSAAYAHDADYTEEAYIAVRRLMLAGLRAPTPQAARRAVGAPGKASCVEELLRYGVYTLTGQGCWEHCSHRFVVVGGGGGAAATAAAEGLTPPPYAYLRQASRLFLTASEAARDAAAQAGASTWRTRLHDATALQHSSAVASVLCLCGSTAAAAASAARRRHAARRAGARPHSAQVGRATGGGGRLGSASAKGRGAGVRQLKTAGGGGGGGTPRVVPAPLLPLFPAEDDTAERRQRNGGCWAAAAAAAAASDRFPPGFPSPPGEGG